MSDLSATELDRYARQIVLEEIGPDGQAALGAASVLVVGAGGLGAPAIQYLAAGGVGHLTIVDDDTVERSNLQRQVIHGVEDVGRPKVDSAREAVGAQNPGVTVETRQTRLDPSNARTLIADHDAVLDASDDVTTRFVVSDAATLESTPVVHGAVHQFEGQVTVFPGDGPCYRCLIPESPPEEAIPDCATAGVLGVVPGTIGTLQATALFKCLLDVGDSLAGRLVVYDAAGASFESVRLRADPDCPACGAEPSIAGLDDVDYDDRCRPR